MASSYSSDLKLELITTGEKAGLWGTIQNTNLQILQQASSGYVAVAVGGSDVTLALDNGSVSNGKNLYLKLTGTLTGNRTVTMPASAERVFILEDATVRGTANRTLSVLTASGTALAIPVGAVMLVKSDGTNTTKGITQKGYNTITDSNTPYTAVAGDQVLANTTANPITITLPAAPVVGDEVTIIDTRGTWGSNNCIIDRNSKPINSGTSNLTLSTNGQAITLVYIDATRGWAYKTNTA
tara:strand:- start:2020 stop:2739 length:720 start_codon:yes stop_codon:yes gene_type:complete